MAGVKQNQGSDATSLGTTAAIVGQGSDVPNQSDFKAGNLESSNRSFTTGTRPTNQYLNLAHTLLKSSTTSRLGGGLRRKRSALTSAFEATGSG
jgi:predicted amino acid dehydrogenase